MRARFATAVVCATVASAIALVPGTARAITFDARGVASFDPHAVYTQSFEDLSGVTGLTINEAADAIDGKKTGLVATRRDLVTLPVTLGAGKKAYRARLYARGNRLVGDVIVDYPADGGAPSSNARFYPTGRVTSDGWYEVTTGVFMVDGSRTPTVSLTLSGSSVELDAAEIVEEGTYRAPNRCTQARDAVCAASEYCAADWCRNGDALVPPLPATDARKAALADYLAGRLQLFFGGRFTRENRLPTALATLAKARTARTAWEFWNGFAAAIHQLHDWHTRITGPVAVDGRGALPICVVEGDGDLSHAAWPKDPGYPDVLVSLVGTEQASGFQVGDRIVAIDGVHPFAWVESLEDVDWESWRSNDPRGHAEAAERLRYPIRRWAKSLTIIRCNKTTKTCGAPETLLTKDLPTTEPAAYPTCDHRPQYHFDAPGLDESTHAVDGVNYGLLRDSTSAEAIFGMVWDDVYLTDPAQNPYADAIDALRAKAKGVVLDHRTGNGGTENAAEYLTTLFRKPAKLGVASGFNQTLGLFDAPFTPADGLAIFTSRMDSGDAYDVGDATARTEMRAAVLLARDGSASDWWPEGMKGSPNVRLFGRQTAGAFSSFFQFDYYGGLNWQFGSGDYVRADGTTHLGEGVTPDEEIVPKQSDLLAGKDTAYERALAWVRTGVAK